MISLSIPKMMKMNDRFASLSVGSVGISGPWGGGRLAGARSRDTGFMHCGIRCRRLGPCPSGSGVL
ncbi:hypothetical protein WN55_07272 [Dufourea novaeangliae]|uniref:Uncharacterized protein n=1 Tax=Dufourea novaeangliae TaxID=178035 RepID=A0A154PRK6_DUFNO|nr:hypothetical protein WN55_07272 [Dufourea novaeangliae]